MGKGPAQILLQVGHPEGPETYERIASVAIRDMQIKTTMRYHFTLVIIYKSTNNKYWRGCGEKGTPVHCYVYIFNVYVF